ncbi:DNRLRE domain-containing protein [Microbacterium ureisolvens]|uniref:DNRLRE domain-containing protein n=1 Tax=Microbacterium ureisolvens TaxID=2781186 RepID=A0ABS7I4W2_9MICO|nr:DNRLRE domain-containing protein [Microbacterium ureisolvens]
MVSRIWVGVVACLALVVGLVAVTPSERAAALSPGVGFSADELPTWQTNGTVYALAQSAGKVVAGGTFSELRPPEGGSGSPIAANGLAILDAETGNPDSCQLSLSLIGGTPAVYAATTAPDGNSIYIGGNFSNVGGVSTGRIAQIDVRTCTVSSLRLPTISSIVQTIAVKGTTMYFGGMFLTVGGESRQRFAAVDVTTGALLPWTANVDDIGRGIGVSPDGTKVAIGGDFFNVNGAYSHSIAVVDAVTGANIRTYPSGFIADTSVTKHIFSGDDGKFYISNEGTGGGVFDGRAAFSWATGDQLWRDTCLGATQMTLQDQTTLYSVSHGHNCDSVHFQQDGTRHYFLAQSAVDGSHVAWDPKSNDGIGEGIGPRALVIAAGRSSGQRYMWSGGDFTTINGAAQDHLTRFGTTDTGNPPAPAVAAVAQSSGSIEVRIRTSLDDDDSELTYQVFRNNSSTPIWSGTASSVWWNRPQVTFVDAGVTAGATYTYRVRATDGTNTSVLSQVATATAVAPTADYAASVRASAPAIFWRGDAAGSWLQDASASTTSTSRQAGVIENGAAGSTDTPVPNDTSGSLVFDGADDYVWHQGLAPAPTTYSVETWIKTTTTRGGKIVGFGSGRPRTDTGATVLSGSYDRHLYMTNTGRVLFGAYTGSTVTLTSPGALNDGSWHHIVGTQGAGGMALYVDGVRVAQNTNAVAQAYWGVWHVGGDNLSGWPNRPTSNFFAGTIDETAVYATALTAGAVADHYQAAGRDLGLNQAPADAYGTRVFAADPTLYWRLGEASSNTAADAARFGTYPGTYRTGVTKGQPGIIPGNTAVSTPGTLLGTVATQASLTPSTAFTGEIWFNTTTPGGKLFGFENVQTGNGTSYDKHLYMTSNGNLVFGSRVGSSNVVVTSPLAYADGNWHQAVGVLDSSGRKLYVDGVLVAQSTVTGAETGNGYWRIGGGNLTSWPSAPLNSYFRGTLDEFSLYSGGVSATEIARHYALGVQDVAPPSAPSGLAATHGSGGVDVSWTASTDNTRVLEYRVFRGTTADFSADADSFLATTATTSYHEASPALGTYYYRVTAVDGADNESAPSSARQLDVTDIDAPTTPASAAATQTGADGVTVTWAPSADNVEVTQYAVYRGPTSGFAIADGTLVGTVAGTTFSESGLSAGAKYYRVVARDAAGNASAPSNTAAVTIVPPDVTAPSTPGSFTATLSSGTNVTLSWDASTDDRGVSSYVLYRSLASDFTPSAGNRIAEVTTPGHVDTGRAAGTWYYKVTAQDAAGNVSAAASASVTVQPPSQATEVTLTPTEDAMVAQSSPTTLYGSSNQLSARGTGGTIESFIRLQLPAAPAGTVLTSAVLSVRTSNDSTAATTDSPQFRLVTGAWSEDTVNWNNRPTATATGVLGTLNGATALNTPYTVGLGADGLSSFLGQTVTLRMSGANSDNVRLWSAEASSASYRPSLRLTFTPVSGPDTQAPTAPTGLATTVANNADVTVTWSPSTDNVAVTGYSVYRGTTAGFTADAASKIADATAASYTDNGRPQGIWYYKVTARDAENNVSAPSASTFATILANGGTPVEMTVPITDDAMVAQSSPTTLYGTSNQLSSRGTGGTIESFLAVPLPAAPAGTVLTGAVLSVRTSTDGTAASADAHELRLMSGAWTEAAVNWNNRPQTTTSGVLGSLTGATALNTPYTVALSAEPLASALGQTVTLRMSSSGADNVRVWSAEATSATYRPSVRLTFTPVAGPDTTAPSAPAGLAASVVNNADVNLTWSASTDDTGVTGYTVYRGSAAGFTADSASRIADVTTTSYGDSGRPTGTWYYKVTARDAAGNVSAASTEASGTITPPAVPPVVQTVVTTADTMVAASNATGLYGTTNQLSSRFSTAIESFMSFALPAAPAGMQLTGVSLAVRTSTDTTAASADTHVFHLMTGTWDEATMTWNNRITQTASGAIGQLSGAAAVNTAYTATLSATDLAGLAGQTVTVRMSSVAGTDNVRIWSREATTAAYRPTLTLTYTAVP